MCAQSAYAQTAITDQLVSSAQYPNGEVIPYILTAKGYSQPRYALILMPGGMGLLNPVLQDGQLIFQYRGNFLIRSRRLFTDDETVAASTNATGSPERMLALVEDLATRFPGAQIYIIGTSRSTFSTMQLSAPLDGKVAGFIHTSSMNEIARFNFRDLKSRHLIVHHQADNCRLTRYDAAAYQSEKYGTEFITMTGGISTGDDCEAFSYHGYNGIEQETVDQIKRWIKRL